MTDNVHDFQLRYVGKRFDGARLPVDVLGDLPAFRDLLVSFVKDSWRLEFTDRTRLPKGFDRSLSFDLVKITDGSAVPNINWNRDLAQTYLPGFVDQLDHLVENSFAKFVELIDSADEPRFSQALSLQQIRALNKLGAGLRDDERIEFLNTRGKSGSVIYLDIPRRKKLITRVQETYGIRIDGIGQLVEARAEGSEGHILINTVKYGYVRVELDPESVVEEFAPYLQSEIQYDLQVEVDHKDQVRGVSEIHDIGVIEAEHSAGLLRCRERLHELRKLAQGWDDGDGMAISEAALLNAERLLGKRSQLCSAFRIYPNEVGGVLLEFETRKWAFTIEFRTDSKIEMFGVETDGEQVFEPTEYTSIGPSFLSDFDKWVSDYE